jgi:hypothetical protein
MNETENPSSPLVGDEKYYFCAIFMLMPCTVARQMREFDFFML